VAHLIISKSFESGESVAVMIGCAVLKILVIEGEKKWFQFCFADEVEQQCI
jgi:hypothetical protein